MGTTTKMAIPYPEATGLVKDGWEDMKDIATQVDAKSGLVLISTTTIGSAVSSISVNDCFSTNFDTYKIFITYNSASAAGDLQFRLRVSATDNSSSNYRWATVERNSTNTTVSGTAGNTSTSFDVGDTGREGGLTEITINNPFTAQYTSYVAQNIAVDNSATRILYVLSGGGMTVTTSYTGFTVIPSTNTLTGGQITVYGVNK